MTEHGLGTLVLSLLVVVLAILGLFLASRAVDAGVELAGLGLFAFMTLFGFGLIARHTGHQD